MDSIYGSMFSIFENCEDMVFPCVFSHVVPCRLNSDTGKKAGVPANKACGNGGGARGVRSQRRDLAGFLKDDP